METTRYGMLYGAYVMVIGFIISLLWANNKLDEYFNESTHFFVELFTIDES